MYQTESGNVPPLVPNAAGLQGGGGAAGAAGAFAGGAAGPGSYLEVYVDGAVALQATVESRAAAAGATSTTANTTGYFASARGTTESAECSGRGVCDRRSGMCHCSDGYRSSNGNGAEGTRGDCGYYVPQNARLWEAQTLRNELLKSAGYMLSGVFLL